MDVNIKADVEEGDQDEDFGVKLEEEEEDNVQPIQEIRLDCREEEEEEEVVGEEGDGDEEVCSLMLMGQRTTKKRL